MMNQTPNIDNKISPIRATNVFDTHRYVWLFQCSRQTAIHAAALNQTTRNLPRTVCQDGRWVLNGQLVIGPDTGEIIGIDITALKAGIEKDGFYMWNADFEPLPNTLKLMR